MKFISQAPKSPEKKIKLSIKVFLSKSEKNPQETVDFFSLTTEILIEKLFCAVNTPL